MKPKKMVIIAGPNGAGKTTFAREYLSTGGPFTNFINADLIAAGLSPFKPEAAAIKAGRLMIREIQEHLARGDSFAIETTLSGTSYARQIPQWREVGYFVSLVFLELPDAEAAINRVSVRVKQGGHNIPEDVIRRRFHSGLENFSVLYKPLVNRWIRFDNSGPVPLEIDRSPK
jgi:predicted ABC-type ATPase